MKLGDIIKKAKEILTCGVYPTTTGCDECRYCMAVFIAAVLVLVLILLQVVPSSVISIVVFAAVAYAIYRWYGRKLF